MTLDSIQLIGDGRASEQPGLTSIHTIFMREHNRLADGLRELNPRWEDERLYQTARRIEVAEYQHIVYNEFLPRILGNTAMNLYGLSLESPNQYFKGKYRNGAALRHRLSVVNSRYFVLQDTRKNATPAFSASLQQQHLE